MTLQMRDRENYRKGCEDKTMDSIKKLMKNLKCSIDKAMEILEIPVESREYYKKNMGL